MFEPLNLIKNQENSIKPKFDRPRIRTIRFDTSMVYYRVYSTLISWTILKEQGRGCDVFYIIDLYLSPVPFTWSNVMINPEGKVFWLKSNRRPLPSNGNLYVQCVHIIPIIFQAKRCTCAMAMLRNMKLLLSKFDE